MANEASDEVQVTEGTGNVFADLGLPDAGDRQTKTRLAMQVNAVLKARHIKQVDAASILRIPQSKVSALANYRLDHFSVERLMSLLNLLHCDVEIVIRPSRGEIGHTRVFALS
ncbi:MAG: transcriptional regulator [Phenylobacterium sp.]|jgi:predicted XRE-type DNA-binding protein|nr:transcriptional regulator [Phenylobacterium sp.]